MSFPSWVWARIDGVPANTAGGQFFSRLNEKLSGLTQWAGAVGNALSGVGVLAVQDTRPSVASIAVWRTANTAPVTITAFRDGRPGQHLVLWFEDANTTLAHSSALALAGGVNYTGAAGKALMFVTVDGATWREIPTR